MRFFHPTGRRGAFPGGFSGQLFAGRFSTRGFTGSLLGSGHFLLPKEDIRDSGAPTLAPLGGGSRGDEPGAPALPPLRGGRWPGAAASSPSPNDSGCEERQQPPPGGGVRGGVTSPPRRAEAPLARNPASGPLNHHRERGGDAVPERSPKGKPPGLTPDAGGPSSPHQPALRPQRLRPPALTADGASNHEQTRQRLPNAEVLDRFFDRRAAPAAQ